MIEALREWLLSVLLLCVFCALADSLMPSGAVKQVGKLVCGLVLVCGLTAPLLSLDLDKGQRWLEEQLSRWDENTGQLANAAEEISKPIIDGEYAAYIVDKAEEKGILCTARVESEREEETGMLLPREAWITGALSEADKLWLREMIGQDLGIPIQQQYYSTQEDGL